MLSFLFWNMGGELPAGTPANDVAARNDRLLNILWNLVSTYSVDILLLAECPVLASVLGRINFGNANPFRPPDDNSLCGRVNLFPRFPGRYVGLFGASESDKYTCRHVRLPGRESFLLFAAHMGSKLYRSDDSQTLAAPVFSPVIVRAEKKAGHDKTVLVGDLNLNPFDPAMVGAEGLNAVMTRDLALQRTRTVDRKEYPFFYNPMWGFFGDRDHDAFPPGHADHEPPGTCYFSPRESRWYYWNILDQVLLRPSLLHLFENRNLKVLTTDGATSFLTTRGTPDALAVSDHLPVWFALNI